MNGYIDCWTYDGGLLHIIGTFSEEYETNIDGDFLSSCDCWPMWNDEQLAPVENAFLEFIGKEE